MSNQTKIRIETESRLRMVIEKLIDCQDGFEKIGESVRLSELKEYFLAESLLRAHFRGDLEAMLCRGGMHDVKNNGAVAGSLVLAWGSLTAKLGGGDHALMVAAEEMEDAARQAYGEALDGELPLPVRQKLTSQFAHILTSREFIRAVLDDRAQ